MVGDTHRRFGAVDVLAAGPAGAVDVDAQVRRIDFHPHVVIHFRGDEYGGEGGMAPVARIEGRFTHQPVHADLGAQPTEGIVAVELDGCALDARHLAWGDLDQLGPETPSLPPPQVHAQQHLGPILGLGAAGPGLDIQEGVVGVHLSGEHAPELQLGDAPLMLRHIRRHQVHRLRVLLLHGHGQEIGGVGQRRTERVETDHHGLQGGPFLTHGLRALGVLPEIRHLDLAQHLGQAILLFRIVKDTP